LDGIKQISIQGSKNPWSFLSRIPGRKPVIDNVTLGDSIFRANFSFSANARITLD